MSTLLFNKDKKSKDGLRYSCKKCDAEYRLLYRKNNRESLREKNRNYYINNKDYFQLYHIDNKEKINVQQRAYYQLNKLEKKEYNKKYKKENRKKIRKQEAIRFKNDPSFRIRKLISSTINSSLKNQKSSKKSQSIIVWLKYTIADLMMHLEFQFEYWMNWENHGAYNTSKWNDQDSTTWTWQIDHIIPHSLFTYKTMEDNEFQRCWSLENLRPLSAKQNHIDGVKRVRHSDIILVDCDE